MLFRSSKRKEVALIASFSRTKKKTNKKNKGKTSVVKPKEGIAKNKGKATLREDKGKGKCFYCQGEEHWKRYCPKYLESLKTKGKRNDGVSLVYILLNVLKAHLMYGYWISVLVLTFVHSCRI